MQNLLAVGLGGFLGAIARYTVGGFVDSRFNTRFPWGTLTVNLLGCLLIGAILGWVSTREASSRTTELFLVTGILGSLTTFSTFGHDTVELLRQGALGPAAGNVALNVIVGLTAVALGLATTRGWG
ncbi:MAG: fluoride efflux transporter CrcB [Planctomycetota bacterium]|nr:fluoride efflux transporter CrcB [Planctomycetaceae bacterium]MEC7556697.1 fluoride efflux transporter CrcB [Planctomycetota bacterium]MEC9008698.1 fluoride efflux transporter CrcB [Planctomycetota bacterium]MEE3283825.1 fluoride efflux transporter CrcB [Planctomycetota bacterium]MEE3367097.1 fluoride efflux transporter CrcB [Planctomycetota bacterium]